MKNLLILFSLLVSLNSTSLSAQNFIRAYSNLPFTGPPGLLLPQASLQMPDGRFVMTAYSGLILVASQEGEPLSTFNLSKNESSIDGLININHIAVAGNNEIYAGAQTSNDSIIILKLNLTSGIVWQKGFDLIGNSIKDLRTTSNGSVVVLSSTNRGITQNAIPCLTKVNADGSLAWQKRYFNGNPSSGKMLWDNLSITENDELLLSGSFIESLPLKPHFLRLDADGELIWSKTFTSSNNNNEMGKGLFEMGNGELRFVLAAPLSGTQMATGKLSSDGNFVNGKVWSQMGQLPEFSFCTPSGGIITSLLNCEKTMYINESDDLLFARSYSLPGNGVIVMNNAFTTISDGIAHFGGYSESFFGDFILTLITTSFAGETATGFSTVFNPISENYNPTLETQTVIDSAGPGTYTASLYFLPTELCYDTLYAENPLSIQNHQSTSDFIVYPNPSAHSFSIKTAAVEGYFEFYNSLGMLIDEIPSAGLETEINSIDWPKGNYTIVWKSNKTITSTRSFIKQ